MRVDGSCARVNCNAGSSTHRPPLFLSSSSADGLESRPYPARRRERDFLDSLWKIRSG